MSTVNIHEAKLEAVAAGEEVIIAKAGKPIAKLVPIEKPKRKAGALKGTFIIDDAFFEPLPHDGQGLSASYLVGGLETGRLQPRCGGRGRLSDRDGGSV